MGLPQYWRIKTSHFDAMSSCKRKHEFLSFRQIAQQYHGAGTTATWRSRLRRNTRDLRSIARKIGGYVRVERADLESYLGLR